MTIIVNDQDEHARAEERQEFCAAIGIGVPKRRHKCMACFRKFYAVPQVKPSDPRVACDECLSEDVVVFD